MKKLRKHLTTALPHISQNHLNDVINNLKEFRKALTPKKSSRG